jgi:hypothetical protein
MNSFAQTVQINDANAEKRALSGSFNAIKVSDGIDLYLTQGEEETIAASASDQKYLANLKTEVKNNVLHIYYDREGIVWNDNVKRKLKAYVAFKNLVEIKANSGADIISQSTLQVPKLSVDLSSGAHFTGAVKINQLSVKQSSGAEANFSGSATELSVDVNSGAIFKGFDLKAEYVMAEASSGAGVRIQVAKELNAKANSGGGIRYKGEGVISKVDVGSGGTVKKAMDGK